MVADHSEDATLYNAFTLLPLSPHADGCRPL